MANAAWLAMIPQTLVLAINRLIVFRSNGHQTISWKFFLVNKCTPYHKSTQIFVVSNSSIVVIWTGLFHLLSEPLLWTSLLARRVCLEL